MRGKLRFWTTVLVAAIKVAGGWSRADEFDARHQAIAQAKDQAGGMTVASSFDPASQKKQTESIRLIEPPEAGFFSKALDFEGLPIKAHRVVSNLALQAARERLDSLFAHLGPYRASVLSNLVAAGVEVHIIGREQVTTDLPEWRQDKGVPLAEYGGLTRDERTRGMGGRLVSCGEENLLRLGEDRYRGRNICVHEFSHCIRNFGVAAAVRARFDAQYYRSLASGLWLGSYAATNPDEFFAELSMWYFGTHGDLGMTGEKPAAGPEGLRAYDPEAYALFDAFYGGRLDINAPKGAGWPH